MVRRRVAATASPCCNQGGDHKACRLAYLPAFACNAPGQEARRDKGVQELMRHADSRTTLDIYSQSDDEDKRAAQKHVSGLFVVEQVS